MATDFAPHNLTSNWSPGFIIAYSEQNVSYPAFQMFDNNSSTFWLTDAITGWLQVTMAVAQELDSYSIKIDDGTYDPSHLRAPKAWTMQGSNDGSTWTTVDTRTSETGWTNSQIRTYTSASPGTYRFYKWNITANNGDASYLMVGEVYLYANTLSGILDYAPHNMTGDSAPSPYVAAASTELTSGGWYAFRAFDGLSTDSNRWVGSNGTADWLSIDLGSGNAIILSTYTISIGTGSFAYQQGPKSWTMQGSNNGTTWTTLDTESGQVSYSAGECRIFVASSSGVGYRYFRVNVSVYQSGSSYVSIGELYLWGTPGGTSVTGTGASKALVAVSGTGIVVGQRGNIDFDQIRATVRQGNAGKFQMSSAAVTGDIPIWDANGNLVDGLVSLPSGGIKAPSLPSSNPGAGSKQLWYDPTDGNRVKYSP